MSNLYYKILIYKLLILFLSLNSFSQVGIKLDKGNWLAHLQLNETVILPFKLEINKTKKKYNFYIHNAEEVIKLNDIQQIDDSIKIDFPNFHSFLKFKIKNKTDINGYWYNLNKGNNYAIPFSASSNLSNEKCKSNQILDITGKWKSTFSPNTKNEDIALGIFNSSKSENKITGTFLTETGDYRYLEGKNCEDKFYLSCFDGSHAFLFTGKIQNEKISGNFYSGKHYVTTWSAEKNDSFLLRNPDSLTYKIKKDPLTFKLKTIENKEFIFPNPDYVNKVTIIQIMGTWCPNCLDETKFLKEMYEKYHQQGLEIISIGYETPNDFQEQAEKIKMLKNRLNLNYTFLVGGQANKSLASEHFSVLNKIISFPTAIFIDKNGEIVKIHTGFNGPGTGQIYLDFKKDTEFFIQSLLK